MQILRHTFVSKTVFNSSALSLTILFANETNVSKKAVISRFY